jgi:hypothetical protein
MDDPLRIYLIVNLVEVEPLGDLSPLEVEILSTMSEKDLDRLITDLLNSECE